MCYYYLRQKSLEMFMIIFIVLSLVIFMVRLQSLVVVNYNCFGKTCFPRETDSIVRDALNLFVIVGSTRDLQCMRYMPFIKL